FFQAEDGIRDKLVTGVQTCALPISSRPGRAVTTARLADSENSTTCGAIPGSASATVNPTSPAMADSASATTTPPSEQSCALARRSEERRVGKGGRSRALPYRY